MELTIETDAENDQLYLAFSARALKQGVVKRTLRLNDDIALDFDGRGTLLGLDVSNASKVLRTGLGEVHWNALVGGVKEAAALVGVRPSNFVRDYAGKRDFPPPVAELANGRVWLQSQVEEYVSARKRKRAS